MLRRLVHACGFAALALGTVVFANDEIYLKGKTAKMKAPIAKETAKGIELKSGQKIPAEEIDDIYYELNASPIQATLAYRGGFTAEREWLASTDAKKRATLFADAIDKYQKAVANVTEPKAKAHLDFKIGYLRGKKAREDNTDPKGAITYLRSFVKSNPNSWQVTRALILLAGLQNDSKDYSGAEESFAEILKLDVSDDVKSDAKLQGALANIQLGKHAAAEAKLAELVATLPKGSKSYSRALVAQSECLMAANKTEDAIALLKKSIKESDDKGLRAAAFNAVGTSYFKENQLKDALWEFLWVDMVYNQDRNEHARALYYLSHIFDRLADPDKAVQTRAMLMDPGFAGTEYQRKLQKEQSK